MTGYDLVETNYATFTHITGDNLYEWSIGDKSVTKDKFDAAVNYSPMKEYSIGDAIDYFSAAKQVKQSYVDATITSSEILVNGKTVAFSAYRINDNNYFKLRDLAYILRDTKGQLDVGWDSTNNSITLTSGKPYSTVGGEMAGKGSGNEMALPTDSTIYLDGKRAIFMAYNIDGNNYFKLRDIGAALNFGVDWDGARNTIEINTNKGYTGE